jgi:hypothetical protein
VRRLISHFLALTLFVTYLPNRTSAAAIASIMLRNNKSFIKMEEDPKDHNIEELESWSTTVSESDIDDDGDDLKVSYLGTILTWSQKKTRMQKALSILGAFGAVMIVTALVLIFQKYGSNSAASANKSVSSPTGRPTNQPLSFFNPGSTNVPEASNITVAPKSPTESPTKEPVRQPTNSPTTSGRPSASPTEYHKPTYVPGNLTTMTLGLLLSEGLDARLIATSNQKVRYDLDLGESKAKFHKQPDAGATFPDSREGNPGGWIYVSNSEVENKKGGVGALTFDKDGSLIDYQIVLEKTSMNCGGGRTPWGTWASCEEVEFDGQIYQVDPTGERKPEIMTLGMEGGRWESFAFDIRDRSRPLFFATEDHSKGTVRRYTPDDAPDWNEPWGMLHGPGKTDFLIIFPNATKDGGLFEWTDDKEAAKNNARSYYPMTEGIDVYGSQLFFVCKKIKQVFVLDLDEGTYYNHTTLNGLFDGKPDQMQRVLGDSKDLLYFTEEGGVDSGVHARDHLGRFYTVFESPVYNDETTGLSFSPDGLFMYAAYQNTGSLFTIWRTDGLPFHAAYLDVKYHHTVG